MYFGVFGKHPGWNDHIDDIGLETERLVSVKSLVYLSGIGARIDSGAWDALPEEDRLAEFDHLVLMRWPGEVVLARVWSSTDGKGRSKYPMIAAIHAVGAGLDWVLRAEPAELEAFRERCRGVQTAAEVIGAADSTRASLRAKLGSLAAGGTGEVPDAVIPGGVLKEIAAHPGCAPNGQGFLRVMYQLESEGAGYLSDGAKAASLPTRPLAMRVPRCASTPVQGLERWAHAMLTRVSPAVPMLLAAPMTREWVDIVIGEAVGPELFCLKAGPGSIPLASEVPYTMDDAFVQRTRETIAAAQSQGDIRVESGGAGSKKGGGWSGFGLGGRNAVLAMAAGVSAALSCGNARVLAADDGAAVRAQPGATEPDVVDPREQYNRALRALRERVRGLSDQEAQAAVREFQRAVQAMPGGVWYLGQVSKLSEMLDRLVTGEAGPQLNEDLSASGPASTGVYRAVKLDVGRVRFDPIAPSSLAAPIEFRRVDGAPGAELDHGVYLAVTELSVGQAIGILRAQRLEAVWRELSPPVDPRDDAREGLRTWEWSMAPAPLPKVSASWLGASRLTIGGPAYPAGHAPKPPTASSPMQQIAPADALVLAAALGCRLPTVAEWTSAANLNAPGKANIRDATWRKQQEYVEQQMETGRYLPSAELGTFDAGAAAASKSAAEVDDGVLWLSPVDAAIGDDASPRAGEFVHLLGNVSEFVVAGLAIEDVKPTTAAGARESVSAIGDKLRVIGGSALSPVTINPREPREIPAERLYMGYSDVGLRLAFTAPGPGRAKSMAERVERLLDPLPLLERK